MRDLRQTLGNIGRAALELVWPKQVNCQGCGDVSGADREYLCAPCARRLEELRAPESQRCLGCGTPVEAKCVCDRMPHVAYSRFAFYYQGPVRGVVQGFKYRAVTCMADWMAEELYGLLLREDWLEEVHALVPVPMPAKRLASRGYNQADLLAKALAEATGLPVLDLLERTRETPQQARLKSKERWENLRGAFRARTDARGLRLLLIDDVRTTGATLEACAEALLKAHAAEAHALTFSAVCRPVEGEEPQGW